MTAYLNIPGLTDPENPTNSQNIAITGFGLGATNAVVHVGGAAREVGKVDFSPLTVNLLVNSVTPALFKTISTGSKYDSGRLVVQRSGSKQTIAEQYDFKTLHVQTFTISGTDTHRSTLSLGFIYDSLQITYSALKPDGSPGAQSTAGWNVVTNQQTTLDTPGGSI